MRPGPDFLVRLLAAVAATFVLAPFVATFFPGTPVHRIITRTLQGALLVALVVKRGSPRTWGARLRALGFRGPERGRRFALGAATSLLLLVLLLALSWALGGRAYVAEPHRVPFLEDLAGALLAAVGVSLFEEILVRGYLKDAIGGPLSALLFAGVHNLSPLAGSPPGDGRFDPLFTFRHFHHVVEKWTEPRHATVGFLGLFLLALALNRLRDRTGTLYAGMGVHAGLVFALALYNRVLSSESPDPWLHGGSRLYDGVLGNAFLLALLLAAALSPLPAWARVKHPGPGAPL